MFTVVNVGCMAAGLQLEAITCITTNLFSDVRCAWRTNKAHFSQVQNALFCGAHLQYPR